MVRRIGSFLFAVIAIVFGANIASRAQTPALMTRHVPDAISAGHADWVAHLPSTQSMRLTLVLPLRNQAALDAFLKDVYDPFSPSYRKFLTVDEFTEKFGPAQADYDSVMRFAEANGFTVVGTSRNRMNVDITGTVDNVERAFNVTMGVYQHPTENRTFFAPDREPTPNLGIQLWHISGLDNYSTPHPAFASSVQGVRSAAASPNQSVQPGATTGSGPSSSFLGSDMRAAYYGGTALTGSGQSLGLFEFIGVDLADVTTYFANAGETNNVPITLTSVDTQGTACTRAGPPACDDTEQTIDITQALGMAPGLSSLVLYIGTGGLSGQAIDDAAILNAMATANPLNAQLSCSWGWTPADPSTDDPYFKEFMAQGQTFFADTGDTGAWSNGSGFYWPAESEYVTAVGGTSLTTTNAGGVWSSETGWPYTGGGISPDDIAIPSWQVSTAAGCASCSQTYRNAPDVSANADFSFYNCADQAACTSNLYGGTTFSTPMWAGYMALVNQQAVANGNSPIGFLNPALYTIGLGVDYGLDFHDITSGGNTLGTTVGYDLSTGWGSPNGNALIQALAGSVAPAAATTLTYNSPTTFTNGGAANPSATLTKTSGGAAVPGVSILFTLGSGGSAQTCSGTTGSNGTATCTITGVNQTVGSGTIAASFAGNSSFLASATGAVTVTINAAPAVATTLTYNSPATFTNGNAGNPSATLTQTTGGAAVPGVSILFTLGSGGSAQTCSGTTGSNGTATCTITGVNQTVGSGTIAASFAGNSSFLASATGAVTVTINAAPAVATTLTYNSPATFTNGNAGNPSATLTQTTGGAAVPGVSILFTLGSGGSAQTCSGTTGSNGTATCTIASVTQTAGSTTISASFAGNSTFLASAAGPVSVTITDFTLSVPTGSLSVPPGQTAMFTIMTGSFPGPVTFTASGLPPGAVAMFNPNPVVPPATSTVLTITTTAAAAAPLRPIAPRGPNFPAPSPRSVTIWLTALALATILAALGFANIARGKTLRRLVPVAALTLLIVTAGYVAGCAGGFPELESSSGGVVTPAGTYTITVIATSGTDMHTTTVTLIVQ